MLKEYALIVSVMAVFTTLTVGFIKDMTQAELCGQFQNASSHEFCQKEGSK